MATGYQGGPVGPMGAGAQGESPDAGPGPAGSMISPAPAQADPNTMALGWIRDVVSNARRIGMKYPAAAEEVRTINNAVQRIQQKILQSQPAPEAQAPPV